MWNYINKILITPLLILAFLLNPIGGMAASNTLGSFDAAETGFAGSSAANVFVWGYTTGNIGGTLKSGRMRNHLSSAGSAGSTLVVYSNGGSAPDALLATSDETIVNTTSATTYNYTFSGQNQINLSPNTTYYIGIHHADPGAPSLRKGLNLTLAGATNFVFTNFNDTYPGAESTFSNEDSYSFELGNLEVFYDSPEGETHTLLNPNLYKSGMRVDFDGTDEAGKSGNDPTGNTDTAGTLCYWVNFDAVLSGNGALIPFGMGGDDTDQASNFGRIFFGLRYNVANSIFNRMEFFHNIDNSGTSNRVAGDTVLSAGTDYHVCVSSSGTAWKMYVNGVLQTLTVITGSNTGDWFGDIGTVGTRHFTVGNLWRDGVWTAGAWTNGKVDHVSIWSSQLSDAEITSLYNGGKPIHPCVIQCTNLIHHWKLGEDANGTVTTMYNSVSSNSIDYFTMENMEDADIVRTSYY